MIKLWTCASLWACVMLIAGCAESEVAGAPGPIVAPDRPPISGDRTTDRMNVRIQAAMHWINQNSSYRVTSPPRFLALMSEKEIGDYAANRGLKGNIIAIYDCGSGTMFLNRDAEYERNLYYRSILVHELVHHAQCASHRWGTPCTREGEALKIQVTYLNEYRADKSPAANEAAKKWAEEATARACSIY